MKTSFKILTVLGIDIELHLLFILLIASFLALDVRLGLLWILAFFYVTLHELTHAIVAKRNRITVKKIILWPIGGMAVMDTTEMKPWVEFRMSIVGPLFNLLLAGAFYTLATQLGYPVMEWSGQLLSGRVALGALPLFIFYSFYINLVLGLFNLLLPAFPLDGGRVLRALLATRIDYLTATRYSQLAGLGIATGLFFFGLWSGDLWLMIIAFFIGMAGGGEYQATITHLTLKKIPLSKLVSRDYLSVRPTETIESAARKMMEEKRSAAIIASKPPLVLNLTDLGRAPKTAKAASAARNVGSITPRDSSEAAYRKLVASDAFAVPVVSRGRIVGVVYRADIEKTVRILSALSKKK